MGLILKVPFGSEKISTTANFSVKPNLVFPGDQMEQMSLFSSLIL